MSIFVTSEVAGPDGTPGRPAPVEGLRVRSDVRTGRLDADHIARLAELEGRWPPLLVWASRPELVIDGAHRLAAARRLGLRTVMVTSFHGSADEAFIEAVHRNVEHGLPLSHRDRVRAGQRILARHPDWSDRRIAAVCAVSAHTVGRLRRGSAALGLAGPAEARLGRDGRVRPSAPGVARERVLEALQANPGGSLRAVAAVAGVSPETVRKVRRAAGPDGAPDGGSARGRRPSPQPPRAVVEAVACWSEDRALASARDLGDFVDWFERTDPGGAIDGYAAGVPLGRVYAVADEARRRAQMWLSFARALEGRAGAGTRPR